MLKLNILRKPVDQSWTIQRIAKESPPRTWEAVFSDAQHELLHVSNILDEQERTYGQYYPLKQDIFAAFNTTPLTNVKAVLIGQDPYHQTLPTPTGTVPRAVGMSFSVRRNDTIPSSLNNMYTELANTVRGFKRPDHGDLSEWALQGVLLLNTCLTVRSGQAGSHGDIWLGFINKVLKAIATVNPYCVFMLWGREAQKLKPMLGERSVIFEAAHPSGLSARRGFFGCNHFNMVNDALIKQGKVGINWRISSLTELQNGPLKLKPDSTPANTDHKPQFALIDVNMLPTMTPKRVVEEPTIGTTIKLEPLPTIPNTKQNSSDGSPQKTAAPAIPKIRFGTDKAPEAVIPQISQVRAITQLPIILQ